jgi:hypothetical protein
MEINFLDTFFLKIYLLFLLILIIGNVYEAMFKAALTSPLNKTEVFEGYEKSLAPHLDKEFLKIGNNLITPKL